jgi:hypothetical protein
MLKEFSFGLIVILSLIGSIPIQYGWERTGIAATVIRFLSTDAQRQAAPCNVGQGAVKNQLAMPGSSCGSIETRQKQVFAPGSLHSELDDQQENAGTNRLAASEGAAGRMPENLAIQYVSNVGSDANDGLTWGTAKHTIYGALIALPGGGTNKAGSGTVYVGPASAANPTANAGIWLMGPADPNFASPPTGWLKCTLSPNTCIINIIGVPNFNGGPNSHTNRVQLTGGFNADGNHPVLWFAALGQPITIQNLQLSAGRGGVLGECSDHTRVNTCGVVSETFINDGFGVSQSATNGPALDIAGYSYWLWFRDCGFSGNAYSATGGRFANNAAGMLIDGTRNNGQGLIYVTDANFAGGGIKLIQGSLGVGSLYVTNAIEEGDFTHDVPPLIWFTNGIADSYLMNLNVADAGPLGAFVVENDGGGPGPTILNSYGPVFGPAVSINSQIVTSTVDPLVYGSSGFYNTYMVGNTNAARRIGGLTPTRFLNKANTNSAGWTVPNLTGVLTFTQGVADPFGGTNAATASTNSSTTSFLQLGGCIVYTPVAGDWIVIGEWEKNVLPNNDLFFESCYGWPSPTATVHKNRGMIAGDGNWEFIWSAYEVTGGSPTQIGVGNQISNVFTPTVYGPVMYVIPADTLSDNEVIEFASTMNSVDPNCRVGQICNVAGHPLVVSSYGTMSNCRSAVSPAKCDSAPAGSFVLGVGSTTAKVNTTAVTPDSQILIIEDSSLGAKLGVSCNKTTGRTYMITDRAPGFSFTVSSSFAPTDLPACLSFQLLN